jgi:hypothetical protein
MLPLPGHSDSNAVIIRAPMYVDSVRALLMTTTTLKTRDAKRNDVGTILFYLVGTHW